MLPALQHEAICAIVEAAARFDPTRKRLDDGKPVSFAPFARSHAKWAVHHFLRGGRRFTPDWGQLDERTIELAGADDTDLEIAADIRFAVAALPPKLRHTAIEIMRGVWVPLEEKEALRAALAEPLADLEPLAAPTKPASQIIEAPAPPAPEEIEMSKVGKHPAETRAAAVDRILGGESARAVSEDMGLPLGTVSAWAAEARHAAELETTEETEETTEAAEESAEAPAAESEAAPAPKKRRGRRPGPKPKRRRPAPAPEPEPEAAEPDGVAVSIIVDVQGIGRVSLPGRIVGVSPLD